MSEQAHYAAVKALLAAGGANPMSLDEVKRAGGELPRGYTELYVTERYAEPARIDGWSTTRLWRVQTRAVGDTEDNARIVREKARAALEDHDVVVDGRPGPIGRALFHDPIGEDDGKYSGLSEYAYAH